MSMRLLACLALPFQLLGAGNEIFEERIIQVLEGIDDMPSEDILGDAGQDEVIVNTQVYGMFLKEVLLILQTMEFWKLCIR